jgi:hypothetical protein
VRTDGGDPLTPPTRITSRPKYDVIVNLRTACVTEVSGPLDAIVLLDCRRALCSSSSSCNEWVHRQMLNVPESTAASSACMPCKVAQLLEGGG